MRYIVGLVVLVIALGIGGFLFLEQWSKRGVDIDAPITVLIEPGSGSTLVSSQLQEQGVVDSARLFDILTRVRGCTRDLKAGEYEFSGSVSAIAVLQRIVAGDVVHHMVQLPEGGTFVDFKERLSRSPLLEYDIHESSAETILEDLGIGSGHGEGWFFPDSYRYHRGMSASDLLQTAHDQMKKNVEEVWQTRLSTVPFDSAYELLILASIVEKESGLSSDRREISGVLIRRLEVRMRLQSDPTVIYGLGELFDGDLRRSHLRSPTPYNTYVHYGLPPTPISAPSLDSLHAAAAPKSGNTMYFVARGDGSSEFSETLEQHNRAVNIYQRGQE